MDEGHVAHLEGRPVSVGDLLVGRVGELAGPLKARPGRDDQRRVVLGDLRIMPVVVLEDHVADSGPIKGPDGEVRAELVEA